LLLPLRKDKERKYDSGGAAAGAVGGGGGLLGTESECVCEREREHLRRQQWLLSRVHQAYQVTATTSFFPFFFFVIRDH